MRIVDVSQWGFLLEHDQMPVFVPIKNNFPMPMTSKVQLDNMVVMIRTGDYPFYIDKAGQGHILMKKGDYAKMIMEIMVNYMKARMRR